MSNSDSRQRNGDGPEFRHDTRHLDTDRHDVRHAQPWVAAGPGGGPSDAAGTDGHGEPLPVEVYATPIQAVKWVRLRRWGHTVAFAPLAEHGDATAVYGADATAVCGFGAAHQAPDLGCRCGFHAVADVEQLDRIAGPSLLYGQADVLLAGKVIEHDTGWRASYQQVAQVSVANRCHRCGRPATCLGTTRGGRDVGPTCARHRGRRSWSTAYAAEALGCPVVWVETPDVRDPKGLCRRIAVLSTAPLAAATLSILLTALSGTPGFAAAGGPVAVAAAAVAWSSSTTRTSSGYEADRVARRARGGLLAVAVVCWVAASVAAFRAGYLSW